MAGTNFGWTILVLLKANENFHSPIHFFFVPIFLKDATTKEVLNG